jgi:hypothetical protein
MLDDTEVVEIIGPAAPRRAGESVPAETATAARAAQPG